MNIPVLAHLALFNKLENLWANLGKSANWLPIASKSDNNESASPSGSLLLFNLQVNIYGCWNFRNDRASGRVDQDPRFHGSGLFPGIYDPGWVNMKSSHLNFRKCIVQDYFDVSGVILFWYVWCLIYIILIYPGSYYSKKAEAARSRKIPAIGQLWLPGLRLLSPLCIKL